jgi:hypothetical protein
MLTGLWEGGFTLSVSCLMHRGMQLTPGGMTNSLQCSASSGAMRGARKRTTCERRKDSLIMALCDGQVLTKRPIGSVMGDDPRANSPDKANPPTVRTSVGCPAAA